MEREIWAPGVHPRVSGSGAVIFSESWFPPLSCCPLSRALGGCAWQVCVPARLLLMCAPDLSFCLRLSTFWKCTQCFLSLNPLWLSSLLQSYGPFMASFCLSPLNYFQTPYDLMSAIPTHPVGIDKCYRNLEHMLLSLWLGRNHFFSPALVSSLSIIHFCHQTCLGIPQVSVLWLIPSGYHTISFTAGMRVTVPCKGLVQKTISLCCCHGFHICVLLCPLWPCHLQHFQELSTHSPELSQTCPLDLYGSFIV